MANIKINARAANTIRKRYRNGAIMQTLANDYSLCVAQIYRIIHNINWKHHANRIQRTET